MLVEDRMASSCQSRGSFFGEKLCCLCTVTRKQSKFVLIRCVKKRPCDAVLSVEPM